jgi:hypothetical protein
MTAKTSTRSKSRKPMTEAARQEAAEARSAKLDALHEDLAAQVQTLTTSEGWVAMLHAAARFRTYRTGSTQTLEVLECLLRRASGSPCADPTTAIGEMLGRVQARCITTPRRDGLV